ncbi:MAG: DivIVA domain-containing protein [bacterium]
MAIDPSEIERKKFELSFRGYNQGEVNEFLRQIKKDYEELLKRNEALLEELDQAKKELEKYNSREEKLEEALVSAQRSARLITESSQERAKLILEEAELKAKRTLDKSEQKLGKLKEEIAKLEGQKKLFLTKLRSLITAHSELLNFYEEPAAEKKTKKETREPSPKETPLPFSSPETSQQGILFEDE